MQTKRKRKQWALLAFTMIATFMLQIVTPLTVSAEEEEERILSFDYSSMLVKTDNSEAQMYNSTVTVKGNGNFVVKTFTYDDEHLKDFGGAFYICSDKEFMHTLTSNGTSYGGYSNALLKDGVYHVYYTFASASKNDFTYNYTGYVNNTHFESREAYYKALEEYTANVDVSKDNYKEIAFDESTAIYDETIPAPKMKVDNKLNYQFLNDDAGYMYQVKGRWRSIDDVTINAGAITDKMHYKSTVQCDLLQWVAPVDEVSTIETSSFASIGKDYFYNFLTMYPIENRNIHLSNTITNYDNWYEVPKYKTYYQNFKDCLSSFNSVEVYVRYFKKNDNGTFSYGKWTHYYNNITPSGSSDGGFRDGLGELSTEHFQSQNGLTNEELNDVENLEDSRSDTDVNNSINSSNGGVSYDDVKNELDFSKVTKVVISLYEQAKVLFSMFTTVFSFLPTWAIELIAVSVVIVCFIGIWKVI